MVRKKRKEKFFDHTLLDEGSCAYCRAQKSCKSIIPQTFPLDPNQHMGEGQEKIKLKFLKLATSKTIFLHLIKP